MKEQPERRSVGKSPGEDAVHVRPAKKRGKVDPMLLLQTGVFLTVVAMSLIVLGVIAGPLFLPGVYVLIAGMLLTAAAGILNVIPRDADSGSP